MADEPLARFTVRDAEVIFAIGAEDDSETVEIADAEIILADRSRWSATFLTLDAIGRLMASYTHTGECRSGAYFHVPDLVISSKPGLANMMIAIEDLINQGLEGTLPRLDDAEDDSE